MVSDLRIDSGRPKGDSKIYLLYFVIFAVFAVLFIKTGSRVYTDITAKLKEKSELESDIAALERKIDSLRSIDKQGYSDISDLALAFPDDDPLIFAYSQVKELSFGRSVILTNIGFAAGGAVDEGVKTSNLTFQVVGIKENVLAFINDLGSIAPLLGIGDISFSNYSESGSEFVVDTSVDIFYSPYPKVLPSLESATAILSDDEKSVYKTLSGLQILIPQKIVPADADDTLEDPFTGGTATSSSQAQ